jgi:cytochrome c oxidase subunit III
VSEPKPVTLDSPWSGGGSPFAIGSKKLGMWLFIVSDALTFSALIIAYSYSRVANPAWPQPFDNVGLALASVMTVVLLFSSLTMVFAVSAAHRGDHRAAVRNIVFTMLGGLAFVVLHSWEWATLIGKGMTLTTNPWGVPLFGATFFGLTGLHMTHVIIGVVYLGIVAAGFGRKKFSAEDVEVSGLYWHFVDLVWMFIFPMVYLLSFGG